MNRAVIVLLLLFLLLLLLLLFSVAKHISVERLFRNIHPSLQYTSRSLTHESLAVIVDTLFEIW